MSEKVTKISERDFSRIQNQTNKRTLATALLDKAIAEAKTAELEYTTVVQKIYLENGLNISCKIKEDGTVVWPEEVVVEELQADSVKESKRLTAAKKEKK